MYERILAYVKGNLWAIRDEYADVIAEILNMRAASIREHLSGASDEAH